MTENVFRLEAGEAFRLVAQTPLDLRGITLPSEGEGHTFIVSTDPG